MFFIFILTLIHFASGNVLRSSTTEWQYLAKHPTIDHTNVSDINLTNITASIWEGFVEKCPSIPNQPKIKIAFDYSIQNTNILAWASQTLHLTSNGTWVSTIYEAMLQNRNYSLASSFDMTIGVNPDPPNGWFIRENCSNISYRYDLRTVLKHEFLHGIIMAGSLRENANGEWIAGYSFNNVCYPRMYDTKIKDENNNSILSGGCNLSDVVGKELFINGVRLYHPYYYQQGSSISHIDFPSNLMYASLPSMTCLDLGHYEGLVLSELGISCTINNRTYNSATKSTIGCVYVIIIMLIFLLC